MNSEAYAEKAAIYALLGRIFVSELDAPTLESLKEKGISSVFEKLHSGFQSHLENTNWDEAQLEQLASDYCHLFILPKKSSLSLSARHWLKAVGVSNLDALEGIINELEFNDGARRAGLENLPNDHLGILLYFISAIYASDDEEIQKLGPPLVQRTLLPWIARFNDKLSSATSNIIYLASGKLLLELLEFENTDLQVVDACVA